MVEQVKCCRTPENSLFVFQRQPMPENFFVKKDRTPELEKDEEWLQLCTYCVVTCQDRILTYRRAGSEGRLTGKISFGVGGHVTSNSYDCCVRELREELNLNRLIRPLFLGQLYVDKDPVSRVHVGSVYHLPILLEEWVSPSDEIPVYDFQPLDVIESNYSQLETWSKALLLLDLKSILGL